MGAPGASSFPGSFNPFHPYYLISLPVKAIQSLDFLFLQFLDKIWLPPSDFPDLDGRVVPGAPGWDPGGLNTINELVFNSPDSPLSVDVPPPTDLDDSLPTNGDAPRPPDSPSWNLLTTIANLINKTLPILPLVPPFLYQVINSKQKHLQNINVEITATSKRKIYKIEFGKKDSAGKGTGVFIVLEVAAGQPIKLMHEIEAATRTNDYIDTIFPAHSIFERVWKRQEYHTECTITVKDPGNCLLDDGSIVQFIPLAKHEGFKIVHKDPTLIKSLIGEDFSEYDYHESAEDSGYSSFSYIDVKLDKPMPLEKRVKTEAFLLPFKHYTNTRGFLEITQYQ